MGKVIEFPVHRILLASAQSFATREWGSDETANEILASMAGNPIPPLGIRKIYDLSQETEIGLLLLDFFEDYKRGLSSSNPYDASYAVVNIYTDRILDMVGK